MLLRGFTSRREAREFLPVLADSPVGAQQQMPGKTRASNVAWSSVPRSFRQKSLRSAGDSAARKHRHPCCSLRPAMLHLRAGTAGWVAMGGRGWCQCLECPLFLIKEGCIPFPRRCAPHGAHVVLALRAGLQLSLVSRMR